MFASNNLHILHRFRDNTTFVVYMTSCDLEKSFSFDTTVKSIGHIHFYRLDLYIIKLAIRQLLGARK